jgi:hypothetical protein
MHLRRRAALGVDSKGRFLLAATDYSVDSVHLAASLAKLDVREAVLLDGGFSTAVVWKGIALVNGHSTKGMPSRTVPHTLAISDPRREEAHRYPDSIGQSAVSPLKPSAIRIVAHRHLASAVRLRRPAGLSAPGVKWVCDIFGDFWSPGYVGSRTLRRRRSKLARPYIWRLIVFSR